MFQLFHNVPGLCRIALELVTADRLKPFAGYGKASDATYVRSLGVHVKPRPVEERADDIMLARCSIAKGGCRTYVAYHVS